nr:hypothetical protein [Marinicella sp. W31]MDC2879658.1 hypothetical protein [Marinicella sp. W31]
MHTSAAKLALAGLVTIAICDAALAADPVTPQQPQPAPVVPITTNSWSFELTPYIWGLGFPGKFRPSAAPRPWQLTAAFLNCWKI